MRQDKSHYAAVLLENFAVGIGDNLDKLDWHGKRDMIRCVVKRIEIGNEEINVVYKVKKLPEYKDNVGVQHYCNDTKETKWILTTI